MIKIMKKLTAMFVCVVILASVALCSTSTTAKAASLEYYDSYSTVTNIYNYNGCTGMQGLAIDGNYLYSIKINSATETSAFIARTHKDTGSTVYMTDSTTGSQFFSYLSHANDLGAATIAGKTNLFVATSIAGSYSLVRYEINGTKLTLIGNYTAMYNNAEIAISSAQVMWADDSTVKLLCKKGKYLYYATLGVEDTSGTFELTNRFALDVADVTVNGVSKDLSDYLHQGFEYIDNKIFVPITGSTDMSISIIAVYDIEGVSGTIKNDPTLSFQIDSTTYANKFEIESCAISPIDGKLYFNTNRAITSSDADYDALHYFDDYVYDPAQGDSVQPGIYRWEVTGDKLQSVTTGGGAYNGTVMHTGSISGGEFTDAQYYFDEVVVLEHDRPWIVEWKSEGPWTNGSLLFSAYSKSKHPGNTFIFRRKDSTLLAFGEYTGSQYNNYGLELSDYGIDGTVEHVYSLRNHIAEDGSNMVYVYVDGEVLGPMNNYYIAGTSQGTTSDWLSGKDFVFSYIGTDLHPITDCSVEYIQVWGNGVKDQMDEPNTYRWETVDDQMTDIEEAGLTANTAAMTKGTCSGGVHSGSQLSLEKDVVLLHDRPWSIEWQCEGAWTGGSRFIAAGETSRCVNAPFIYRQADSGIIAFGYYTGSQFNHYGIKLSDHGIDGTVSHVYRLTNRIEADGSNMVYLYVDDVELGAMDNYYVGHTDKGTTSDWVSGRDFTFSYFGTYQHGISDVSFDHIQVWEAGIPGKDEPDAYRWETQDDTLTSITTDGNRENTANMLSGTISDGMFSGSYAILDQSVVLRHDRAWSVEWQSEGTWKDNQNGAMLLASGSNGNTANTVYLYRRGGSDIIAFGHRYNSKHHNYGIKLSDYGIDGTASHIYRLTNRIAEDGSNMVYLFVDGVELGAMNGYYVGGTAQGTTDNWLSGRDLSFSYMGTENFTIGNCGIDYIQVWEGGVPTATVEFRDWDGSLISSKVYEIGDTVTVPTDPARASDGTYTYTFTGWDKEITACTGDAVYTATYEAALIEVPKPVLTPAYPTLSFEGEVMYNIYYTVENIGSVSLEDMGLAIFETRDANGTVENAVELIPGAAYANGQYMVRTNGIPAKNLGDTVFFKIYAKLSDGSYVYSDVLGYNAIVYANDMLANGDAKTKALVVAMLNYGAAAQEFFGYNTDNLMNANLTAEQKTYVSAYNSNMVENIVAVDSSKVGDFSNTGGYSLKYPSVSFDGAFSINYYFTPSYEMDGEMTLYYWDLETYNSVDVLTAENATGSEVMVPSTTAGEYGANVSGIAAKEIDETIFVAGVYESNGVRYCTGVIAYSLAAYCQTYTENDASDMQDFAQATIVYGYYAKQYFASLI